MVANCITIRGSFVGTRGDMAEALAFAAEGKVKADIELQPLSAINDVFDGWSTATCRRAWCSIFVGGSRGAVTAPTREAVTA